MKWKLAVLVPITLHFSNRRVYSTWDQAKNLLYQYQATRIWRGGMLTMAREGQWREPRLLITSLEGNKWWTIKNISVHWQTQCVEFILLFHHCRDFWVKNCTSNLQVGSVPNIKVYVSVIFSRVPPALSHKHVQTCLTLLLHWLSRNYSFWYYCFQNAETVHANAANFSTQKIKHLWIWILRLWLLQINLFTTCSLVVGW